MYRIGLLFTLGTLLPKQFLHRNSTAPLRCWKWNVPYRIGFWNGPNKVWTLLSEQKLQRNLVLVFQIKRERCKLHNGSIGLLFTLGTLRNNFCTATEHLFLFTLYRSNFCNGAKTYPVQCEHSLMLLFFTIILCQKQRSRDGVCDENGES